MSKSDWFWFTGLLLGIMSLNMPTSTVSLLLCVSSLFCMVFSFFAPAHPDITIRLTVEQEQAEKTPSPFGMHTSEDK